ncbi:NKAP family protein-like isoform X8 [Leucoraja erinacea]|uniref:NKAP family protein-like isoform X8 n=1 Tax=Leucoraja erinaceus TaxID=7782 RepID=UPI0024589631|nr:NKAP family protein-like isoform X8 [Leucoraja erinacea]
MVPAILLLLTLLAIGGDCGRRRHASPQCLEFDILCKADDFEVRRYNESVWVGTQVNGSNRRALIEARRTLRKYTTGSNVEGAWIGRTGQLLTSVAENGERNLFMLLPTEEQNNPRTPTDPQVFIRRFPSMEVFVRNLGFGNAELESSLFNQTLTDEGAQFNDTTFFVSFCRRGRRGRAGPRMKRSSSESNSDEASDASGSDSNDASGDSNSDEEDRRRRRRSAVALRVARSDSDEASDASGSDSNDASGDSNSDEEDRRRRRRSAVALRVERSDSDEASDASGSDSDEASDASGDSNSDEEGRRRRRRSAVALRVARSDSDEASDASGSDSNDASGDSNSDEEDRHRRSAAEELDFMSGIDTRRRRAPGRQRPKSREIWFIATGNSNCPIP